MPLRNTSYTQYRSIECPICDKTGSSTGCSVTENDAGQRNIMCLHGDQEHPPEGWRVFSIRDGWGLFFPQTPKAHAELQAAFESSGSVSTATTTTKKNKEGEETEIRQVSQVDIDALMPWLEQRAKVTKLGHFRGHDWVLESLKKRGLTSAQIDIMGAYDFNGIHMDGFNTPFHLQQLIIKVFGKEAHRFLCDSSRPIFHWFIVATKDFNGKVTGFQKCYNKKHIKEQEIKYRHALEEKARVEAVGGTYNKKMPFVPPKYSWISGVKNDAGFITKGTNEATGDWSIHTLKAKGFCDTVICTEGVIKPEVLYNRLDGKYHVIGSPGARFISTEGAPVEFAALVWAFIHQLGVKQIVWAADAGSYEKEQVNGREQYKRQNIVSAIERVRSWCALSGVSFSVLDWGQLQSKDPHTIAPKDSRMQDPDEVPPEFLLASIPSPPDLVRDALHSAVALAKGDHSTQKFSFSLPPSTGISEVWVDDNTKDQLPELIVAPSSPKFIADFRPLGAGKSHGQHLIPLDGTTFNKHMFISLSPRMAMTKTIMEHFFPVEGRHEGLVFTGNKNPDGSLETRRVKAGEEKQTEANCAFSALHAAARQNNINSQTVCSTCPFYDACKSGTHPDYNYLKNHIEGDKHQRVRMAAAALNPNKIDDKTILTFDEPDMSANAFETFFIKKSSATSHINSVNEKLAKGRVEVVLTPKSEVRLIDCTEAELFAAASAVDSQISNEARFRFERSKDKSAFSVRAANCEEFFMHALDEKVTWKEHMDTYSALVMNYSLQKCIQKAGKVIFLDATMHPHELHAKYDVPLDQLLVIKQDDKATNNVKVNVFNTDGLNARHSSKALKEKVIPLIKKWGRAKHGADSVGFISHSEWAEPGDIKFFVNHRGSNLHEKVLAEYMLGLPQINIEAVRDQWKFLAPSMVPLGWDFEFYYKYKTYCEIKQALGRLRAYRRQDEQLEFNIVANCTLDALVEEGYEVEYKVASLIPGLESLCNQQEQAALNIMKAVPEVLKQGKKLTLEALAQACGNTKQAVDSSLKKLGKSIHWLKELVGVKTQRGYWQPVAAKVKEATQKALSETEAMLAMLKEAAQAKGEKEPGQAEALQLQAFDCVSIEEAFQALKVLVAGQWPSGFKWKEVRMLKIGLAYRLRLALNLEQIELPDFYREMIYDLNRHYGWRCDANRPDQPGGYCPQYSTA